MPIFSLLPFAKPAFDIAQNLLSKRKKPKREDFVQSTDFIKRFIANLRSRGESSEIQNLLLQPEIRRIGAEGRSAFRDIQSSFARVGAPEGAIAEARTGIARTTIQGISEATGKARAAQLQENRRLESRIDRALLQEGAIQSRGDLAFRRAQTGFEESERRRKIGLLGSFVGLATAGLGEVGRARALAAQETTRGIAELRDISAKLATSFQKKFGEFAPELMGQAIDNAGLEFATLSGGDLPKISREIKKLQLGTFKGFLQADDLNLDTIFEARADTKISEKQFNTLLSNVKKTEGETISSVQEQALDIFTAAKPPSEIVGELNKLLDSVTDEKDSKSVLSVLGKARTLESQALTAAERETKKRTDVTEGVTRISELLGDISNTKLFPEEALGETGLGLPSGVEEALRQKGFDPQGGISGLKTQLNETLQKLRRDGTITKDEISNYDAALQALVENAKISSSELAIRFPEFDLDFGRRRALLNQMRNRFRIILSLFGITIPEEQNTSELSTGDFIDQLRSLLGEGGQ